MKRFVLLAAGLHASTLSAQLPEVGLRGGWSVPASTLSEQAGGGPSLAFTLGFGTRSPGFGFRGEFFRERFSKPGGGAGETSGSDPVSLGVRGQLVYTLPRPGGQPYLLIGAGIYDAQFCPNGTSCGASMGVNAGVGWRRPIGPVTGYIEAGMVTIVSAQEDRDRSLWRYFPLSLGVRIP